MAFSAAFIKIRLPLFHCSKHITTICNIKFIPFSHSIRYRLYVSPFPYFLEIVAGVEKNAAWLDGYHDITRIRLEIGHMPLTTYFHVRSIHFQAHWFQCASYEWFIFSTAILWPEQLKGREGKGGGDGKFEAREKGREERNSVVYCIRVFVCVMCTCKCNVIMYSNARSSMRAPANMCYYCKKHKNATWEKKERSITLTSYIHTYIHTSITQRS